MHVVLKQGFTRHLQQLRLCTGTENSFDYAQHTGAESSFHYVQVGMKVLCCKWVRRETLTK